MGDTCHECGREFKQIADHWAQSSCSYSNFSEHQHGVLTGLLMGDGLLHRSNRRPYLRTQMITKDYLSHLSKELFPVLSGDVHLTITAKESAAHNIDTGFSPDADVEDYSDLYGWQTMAHPGLQRYEAWYSSGSKAFPPNIELTPTVLKHWYCGDGHLNENKYPGIALCNESGNKEKINSMFSRVGLTDFFWREGQQARDRSNPLTTIRFRADGTENFFEYVGDPPPGFAYKWI